MNKTKKQRNVALGMGKLLHFTLKHYPEFEFEYILDNNYQNEEYEGIPVKKYSVLENEDIENIIFYIFAVSNHSIKIIMSRLLEYKVLNKKQVYLYSDIFKDSFEDKARSLFGNHVDKSRYEFAKEATLNSKLSVHTTICGSWLFLESLNYTKGIPGNIAEIGCYEGGNMLLGLQSGIIKPDKKIYLFDSFEGFPAPSQFDPESIKQGDYKPLLGISEIKAAFSEFSNVSIIPGYIPETFGQINPNDQYSLVFYDCDLYQPALDTLNYFWAKLSKGGLFLLHDYFYEPGSFAGVEKATKEFCEQHHIQPFLIWESTMAVLQK